MTSVLLAALLPLLAFAVPPCSLNGEPNAANACECDAGWAGPECGRLQLAASRIMWPDSFANPPEAPNEYKAGWGASVVPGADGKSHHLFVDALAKERTWKNEGSCMHTDGGEIAHAVSSSGIRGPYVFHDVALPAVAFNPHAIYDPSLGYLLTYQDSQSIAIARSASPNGPWTDVHRPTLSRTFASLTNPSIAVVQGSDGGGGGMLLAFRYTIANCSAAQVQKHLPRGAPHPMTFCERLGVAYADAWDASTWTVGATNLGKAANAKSADPLAVGQPGEDPHIYRGKRGWHLVFHTFNYGPADRPGVAGNQYYIQTGGHAFTDDPSGRAGWTVSSAEGAFNTTVQLTALGAGDTMTFARRERPEMLVGADGSAAHLLSGVEVNWLEGVGSCRSWALFAEVAV